MKKNTHTHTHTHTPNQKYRHPFHYIKHFFALVILLSVISCSEKYEVPKQIFSEQDTTLRSTVCGPVGDGCTLIGTPTFTFYQAQCTITVQMKITRCLVNGSPVYYFEDDSMPIAVQGTCTNLDDQVEEAYEAYITHGMNILNSPFPDCSTGNVVSSKHIKMECTRLCPSQGLPGQDNYRWVSCADEQGCCIETIEWCDDNGMTVQSDPVNTDNTIGCKASTMNCDGDPIGLGEPEPCGGRCDR